MSQTISENSDSFQTIFNKSQDTEFINEICKSPSQSQSAKMSQDYSYDLQALQPIIEYLDMLTLKLDQDFNLFDENTNSDRLHKASNSDQLHKASNSDRLHKTSNSDQLHKASNSDRLHKASNSNQLHKASNSDQLHKASNSDQLHKASNSNQLHKASNSDQLHKASNSDRLNKTSNSDQLHKASNSDQLHKASNSNQLHNNFISYHLWLSHYYNLHSKSLLNSNEAIPEPNNFRYSDKVNPYPDTNYRYPDMSEILEKQDESLRSPVEKKNLENKEYFTYEISNHEKMRQPSNFQNYPSKDQHINMVEKITSIENAQDSDLFKSSESEKKICCRTDDIKILDNKNYNILMDDCRLSTEKGTLNLSQMSNCSTTKENQNNISQNLSDKGYMEEVKVSKFSPDKNDIYKIQTQNKRTVPRELTKYEYAQVVRSKQTEGTNTANTSFSEGANNYKVRQYQENHISDNLSKTPYFRWPERLTDNPHSSYRYPEVPDKQFGSTRSLVQNNNSTNNEYFTHEILNQEKMTSLNNPKTWLNFPGSDFEYQHLPIVNTQISTKDEGKQENEVHYRKPHLWKISSSYQSVNLNLYSEEKVQCSEFYQSLSLDPKIFEVYSDISKLPISEMKNDFDDTHQENTTFDKYYHSSSDRECTSQNKSDFSTQIKENLCMTDSNVEEEKCPSDLNNKQQSPLKALLTPNSRCEITISECSDPSCKCKKLVLCLELKSQCQANYRGPKNQEDTVTIPSSENFMVSNPEIRDLSQNSQHYHTLEPNYWQNEHQNMTEKFDPICSGLRESELKQNHFSVRGPNDFIREEEVERFLRNLKIHTDGYEDIDSKPDYKILTFSSHYESASSHSSQLGKNKQNIFKRIFRKLKKKSTSASKLSSEKF